MPHTSLLCKLARSAFRMCCQRGAAHWHYRTTANVSYTVNIQTPPFQRVSGTLYLKYCAMFRTEAPPSGSSWRLNVKWQQGIWHDANMSIASCMYLLLTSECCRPMNWCSKLRAHRIGSSASGPVGKKRCHAVACLSDDTVATTPLWP
jgi:hypothetical protein